MAATPPSRPKPPSPGRAAPNGPRVFISHSSKNQPLAAAVLAELEGNGIRCWMAPRDIRPGEPNYGKAIIEGLTACQAMVLLLTEPSNRSQHVMKEAERAVNKDIPILVVKFQPIEVSKELEYYVSSAQFLDATAPPPQQHLRPLRHRVRDMLALAKAGGTPASIAIDLKARVPSPRSRWKQKLVGAAMLGGLLWGGWVFAVPPLQGFLANLAVTATQEVGNSKSLATRTTKGGYSVESSELDNDRFRSSSSRKEQFAEEEPATEPVSNPLMAGVEAKSRANSALTSFAKTRLVNFHQEALLVTKMGKPEAGKVSESDVEVLVSCRFQPNMKGYLTLAKEFIGLLEKTAERKGVITSDGLRTSEYYGRDARPHLEKIRGQSLVSSDGLLDIFASTTHEALVRQHAATGSSSYVGFPSLFLIYDEAGNKVRTDNGVVVPRTDMAGIHALRWEVWPPLLQQQGSGIVVVLESIASSYRHTTWRWFHLGPAEWAAVASQSPRVFNCSFTLTDSVGAKIEGDYYPLKQVAVGRLDNDTTLWFSPFFVNQDFEHYVPEVTLTKSVVVLKDDVRRVKDFAVKIEQGPTGGESSRLD